MLRPRDNNETPRSAMCGITAKLENLHPYRQQPPGAEPDSYSAVTEHSGRRFRGADPPDL